MAGCTLEPAGLGYALLITLRGELSSFGGWFCFQNCSRTPLHPKGFLEGFTLPTLTVMSLLLSQLPSLRFLAEHSPVQNKGKQSKRLILIKASGALGIGGASEAGQAQGLGA